MSGTTEDLRRKIQSAGDLSGVVRSMKALAASSIGQYEGAVESLNQYYRTVELGMAACFRRSGSEASPPGKKRREDVRIGAVIFGSDQGLVGQFNETLVDFAVRELAALHGDSKKIWAVGERIQALLSDSGLAQANLFPVPTSVYGITPLVGQILIEVEAARERGDVTNVYLFHNRPKTGAVFEPVARRLLPLDDVWQKSLAALPWPTKSLPEVIEGEQGVLSSFIRGYLFVLLFQACAESLASENASRLAAMQRAEKNIKEILEDLNRTFHRIRQESIDEELFDVISGYEALSAAAGSKGSQTACR
jgi:F-type H+-transporting ATPase subunit gamma